MEWEQVMQMWEQDVSATDEALSDLEGAGGLAGKKERGDEQAHKPVNTRCGNKTHWRPTTRCCVATSTVRWEH